MEVEAYADSQRLWRCEWAQQSAF